MKEEWKPVKDYEDKYLVSNTGIVKSIKRKVKSNSPRHKNGYRTVNEKILKVHVSETGYERVGLSKNSTTKNYMPHRLVAEAFLPNPLEYEMVNHKDANKLNNHVTNLECCDASHNAIHAVQNDRYGASKLTAYEVSIVQFLLKYTDISQKTISIVFGVARKTINDINTNRTWRHYHEIATLDQAEKWLRKRRESQTYGS